MKRFPYQANGSAKVISHYSSYHDTCMQPWSNITPHLIPIVDCLYKIKVYALSFSVFLLLRSQGNFIVLDFISLQVGFK